MPLERRFLLPIATCAVACSAMMAFVCYGISRINFHFTKGSREVANLPYVAATFERGYSLVWVLPLFTMLSFAVLFCRKRGTVAGLLWTMCLLIVIHFAWFLYWILAIYLSNETFIVRS